MKEDKDLNIDTVLNIYLSAINKLNTRSHYDENGRLKKKYALTEDEMNIISHKLSEIVPYLKTIGVFDNFQRYDEFLAEVKQDTLEYIKHFKDPLGSLYFQIVGIEENSRYVKAKYGKAIYERAYAEARHFTIDDKEYLDLSQSTHKLGYLKWNGLLSPLLDFDFLESCADKLNIPLYIDYIANKLYINHEERRIRIK